MSEYIAAFVLSIAILAFVLSIAYLALKQYSERRKGRDFYLDSIIAYKVGWIKKKAKLNQIKLIYPQQRDEFMDSIENEVESDLNRVESDLNRVE